MKLPLKRLPKFFVRVKGPAGKVRELAAMLDTGSTCTVISSKDAIDLGYQVTYDPMIMEGTPIVAVTPNGMIEAPKIVLEEVRVGDIVVEGLEAAMHTLPEQCGVDVVLGWNFWRHVKRIVLDNEEGTLLLEG